MQAIQHHPESKPQINLEQALCVEGVHPATSGAIREGHRREIQVGELLRFTLAVDTTRTWTLVRAPEGSKATLLQAQLMPVDLPGLYVVRCTILGGFSRDVEIVAFTEKALDCLGAKNMVGDRRLVARSIINDARATRESLSAALEGELPGFGFDGAIVGVAKGFNLHAHGAPGAR